jgi:hypothetical protein
LIHRSRLQSAHQERQQRFHGGAFEHFRNDKLDARTSFPTNTELRFNDFGWLGGPIKRNKCLFSSARQEWSLSDGPGATRLSLPTQLELTAISLIDRRRLSIPHPRPCSWQHHLAEYRRWTSPSRTYTAL